jgi:hypothetical protein
MTKAGKRSATMRRITLMLLCGVSLWGCGAAGRYLGPTVHGYTFHASTVYGVIYLPSDLLSPERFPSTTTLQVQVRGVNAQPATGVPVTIQFAGSECQGVVTLSAQQAVTVQGQASFTVTAANTTGACRLAVGVDNVTQELEVAVYPPPEPRGFR